MSGKKQKFFEAGPPEVEPNEIEFIRKIGEGCFGTVYLAKCRATDVAVKVPKKQTFDPAKLTAFIKEVHIMSKIYAPNIALFMGACTKADKIMIVSEFLNGDVESLLRDSKKYLSLFDKVQMAIDAARGISWLHGSNPVIIHRDIKTSNLLLDKNGRVKVCDFGLSQLFTRGQKIIDEEGAIGTPLYMAPEVMLGDEINEKADVYSFGIALWEIYTRKQPFEQFTKTNDYDIFVSAICEQAVRPLIPPECPVRLRALMEQSWQANPSARPTFPEIVRQLEFSLIEAALEDTAAQLMWHSNFGSQQEIKWLEHFVPSFAASLGHQFSIPAFIVENGVKKSNPNATANIKQLADTVTYRALHAMLVKRNKYQQEIVHIQQFGHVLCWFGPVANLLQNVESTLRQPWFFGPLEADEAGHHLTAQPAGNFLVRFSNRQNPGCFAISRISANKELLHARVIHKMGSPFATTDGSSYQSLTELLTNHTAFGLTEPCPGWPYRHLFATQEDKPTNVRYET
eukprot:TRINITY_DN32_c1_g1_i8.p1 TRINITY_DN32_c1_g1~~TRINITY_DN32_c1_g1_i8.p1  ORF type:complete len:513 (-),score=223.50 TRINITY_DN32_c1_g1_i8:1237-2775(-)